MQLTRETLKKLGLPMPSKYGNKKTPCLSRHIHDSKAEANYCNSLLADKQAGRIYNFVIQKDFQVGPGIVHIVDFVVLPIGAGLIFDSRCRWEVHEVKGHPTAAWRMKYKLFREKYPTIKYVIINRKEQHGRATRRKGPRPAWDH